MNQQARPDTIFLNNLRVDTIVGIWDWERKIRQSVNIDLEMAADVREAAAHDDIEHTLNYKLVAKRVQAFVGESTFKLVETLAERVADLLLSEFDLPWVQVSVSKPGAIRGARDVGVRIYRSNEAGQ